MLVAGSQTAIQPQTQSDTRLMPPYKLILHNDSVNEFERVIEIILELTPLDEIEAIKKTLEAHETGHAVLLITHKERAELYVDQFTSKKLTTTCEPDE